MKHQGIEIENVYWMLAYAVDQFDDARLLARGEEVNDSPLGPFAHCLVTGVERLIRRGVYREYETFQRQIPGIRGRLDLVGTLRGAALAIGSTVCHLDELTYDILHNQTLKSALLAVSSDGRLPADVRKRARALIARFSDVRTTRVRLHSFHRMCVGAHNRSYRFVLDVARFILLNTRPTTTAGGKRFYDLDLTRFHDVFEAFVRGFFKLHLDPLQFSVSRTHRQWTDVLASPDSLALLPRMKTDVVITTTSRKLVIDTKFYKEILRNSYGSSKVREEHLYQLMGYLHNFSRSQQETVEIAGMLLYASTGVPLDARWDIHGFKVRAYALDLSRPWHQVSSELVALAHPWSTMPSMVSV